MGVEWVMTPTPLRGEALEDGPAYVGKNCCLYRVRDAAPFAYFCSRAITVPKGKALETLAARTQDPRDAVVLEASAEATEASISSPSSWKKAEYCWRGPNQIRIRIDRAPTSGWIVVQESWNSGWSARVNGQPTPVRRANDLFMAAAVPAGSSEIVLTFRSRAFAVGLAISAASLVVCAALMWSRKRWNMAESHGAGEWDATLLLSLALTATIVSAAVRCDAWRETFYQASALP
jgi:hypothetical protein